MISKQVVASKIMKAVYSVVTDTGILFGGTETPKCPRVAQHYCVPQQSRAPWTRVCPAVGPLTCSGLTGTGRRGKGGSSQRSGLGATTAGLWQSARSCNGC